MNILVLILSYALMALGAAELIRWAGERAFGGPRCRQVLVLAPEGPEECECLLRGAMARFAGCRIVCVVRDEESREIAGKLSLDCGRIEVCGPGELEALLGE